MTPNHVSCDMSCRNGSWTPHGPEALDGGSRSLAQWHGEARPPLSPPRTNITNWTPVVRRGLKGGGASPGDTTGATKGPNGVRATLLRQHKEQPLALYVAVHSIRPERSFSTCGGHQTHFEMCVNWASLNALCVIIPARRNRGLVLWDLGHHPYR